MTQVARVFVVINLLLAAGFLFSASTFLALNTDWQEKYNKQVAMAAEELRVEKAESSRLRGLNTDLERTATALREENGNLRGTNQTQATQIQSLEADKQAKDTQIADLTRNNNQLSATVERSREDNMRLVETNTNLDAQTRQAREELQAKVTELATANETIRTRDDTIAANERSIQEQADQIKQKDMMLDFARAQGVSFDTVVLDAPAAGSVINADNKAKFLIMNLGKEQGVQRGWVFDIVRGASYIGRCRVDDVHDKMSTATIVLTKDDAMVQPGDRVTNRL